MKRFSALMMVVLMSAGCKSDAPVCDPFFSRTTIPPPPTGSAVGGVAPGYQPPPLVQSPTGAAPPMVQMPSQPSGQSTTTGQGTAVVPQPSAPSGFAPNVSAPRPTSTGSTNAAGAIGPQPYSPAPSSNPVSPTAPNTTSPYAPPGGYQYRGSSIRGAPPSWPGQQTQAAPRTTLTGSAATFGDDRTPRPIDDAAGTNPLAGRQPIVRTLEPRSGTTTSGAVDIADLPAAR